MQAFIGVGANLDPEAHILQALRRLRALVRLERLSTFYRTPPLTHPAQPPFINGVVEVETDFTPHGLKYDVLREIEAELGRERGGDRYAPRPIDLDLLLYDQLVLDEDGVRLPDPEIPRRAFIAIPLCELAPALKLPDTGLPICQAAAALSTVGLTPLPDFTAALCEALQLPKG